MRISDWSSDVCSSDLAGSLGLPSTTQLVGFVGRLNWAKDLVILVDAFARVCARRSDAALVLVGEGEERAAIEAAIARAGIGDRVFLLGRSEEHTSELQSLMRIS